MNACNQIMVILILVLTWNCPYFLHAQATAEDLTDQMIEDAINFETEVEELDWTAVSEGLKDLLRKPLDLNKAGKEELRQLPGITDILIMHLLEYRDQMGRFSSIYELQAVPGFDADIFSSIKPFITAEAAKAKDISPGVMHPQGPPLKEIFSGMEFESLSRLSFIIEQQKGFAETENEGEISPSAYAGSPYKVYSRNRLRYGQYFSAGITGEKDPGEAFTWNPDKKVYGFDYISAHVALKDFGHIRRLVAGDFSVQAGQGLVFSSGLGFGKGGEAVLPVKSVNAGIKPYTSVNENQYYRGTGITWATGNWWFTGFFSHTALDASMTFAEDTLSDDLVATTLQTSGFHRTPGELDGKDVLRETAEGGRLEYKSRTFGIGSSFLLQQFSHLLLPAQKDYKLFEFTGKQNYVAGLDWDKTWRNVNFFGEVARSKSGGTGLVAGALLALGSKTDLSIHFRRLEPHFHSFRGYAFAERPAAVSNETGLYTGIRLKPVRKWTLSAWLDQFRFPWNRYLISYPSKGHEYLLQLEYKPSRHLQIYARYRHDHKEKNAGILPEGQQVEFLEPVDKHSFRLNMDYQVDRQIRIKCRIEHSRFANGPDEFQGWMAYQDLIWKVNYKLKLTGRVAFFDIPNWDARIYAYESDVLGAYSIPAWQGRGMRWYFLVNYKFTKHLEAWARISRSTVPGARSTSSGLNEISGPNRTEVKFQIRILI